MSFLSVNNIFKSFDKTEVLKGISFELNDNSTLALIGKSGSGKTTILRLIAGLELLDSGFISLSGKVITSETEFVKPENRKMGFVFQNHSLFPHLNIYDNIIFGISKEDKNRKDEITYKYMEMLGLQDKLKSYPHQLSGGEKQRISIIRTLVAKPKLLLLDEPFSNLDKSTKEILKYDLNNILKEENLPTIIITHDADDSFDLADEVILLDAGNIVAKGNPETLYKEPQNSHSAKFFSDSDLIEKNESNFSFFNYFNIDTDKIYISPQNINRVNENGIEAKIINHRFIGSGYMVSIVCLGAEIIMFTTERIIEENIQIDINSEKIILIN